MIDVSLEYYNLNIRMREFDTFNFCFSDENNNWDNNNNLNYTSPILPGDVKQDIQEQPPIEDNDITEDETNTIEDTFYVSDSKNLEAAFMYKNVKDSSHKYYQDENLTMVSMPLKKYGDTELEFIAIMPKDLNDYILNGDIANDLSKLHSIGNKEELIIRIGVMIHIMV